MARFSQGTGNVQVTGAASTLRVRWPRGETLLDAVGASKFGPQDTNGFQLTSLGGGASAGAVHAGVACNNFPSAIGAGAPNTVGVQVAYNNRLTWYTERTGGPVLDGWACWGLRLTVAYDNPAGVIAGDLGIMVTCGNQTVVNADGLSTLPGLLFGPNNANVITLRARAVNAGPQTVTANVALATMAQFHTYELRMVSGSNTSDPVLFGLIDNVVVTPRIAWTAAAALLPPPNAIAGNYGYNFAVINHSGGGVANMYIKDVMVTAAQSEGDLN